MTDLVLGWESGAAVRHAHIGIRLEKLFGARDLVRGAMGAEWFEEQERRHDRLGIAHEHPLYRQLHGEFVPYLSALDLVLNMGPESPKVLRGNQ